jgi:hypothetical protein
VLIGFKVIRVPVTFFQKPPCIARGVEKKGAIYSAINPSSLTIHSCWGIKDT